METRVIVVKAARDPDAGVWFIESSDLPGLNGEAETIEALVDKLPALVADLLDEDGTAGGAAGRDIPIEVIAHASTRLSLAPAA